MIYCPLHDGSEGLPNCTKKECQDNQHVTCEGGCPHACEPRTLPYKQPRVGRGNKLSDDTIQQIITMREAGEPVMVVARALKISHTVVGRYWLKHLIRKAI